MLVQIFKTLSKSQVSKIMAFIIKNIDSKILLACLAG